MSSRFGQDDPNIVGAEMPPAKNSKQASQTTGWSFKPFIDLTDEEIAKLSPMTRNAKDVIYVKGFMANTAVNANKFRISDNKYLQQQVPHVTGKPIIFGPKILGKAHHPNFYQDLAIEDDSDPETRNQFMQYQEWARIGDILRMEWNEKLKQWDYWGAISHPNILDGIRNKKIQLPKFVSPYFFNLNDPKDTGPDLREAEILHIAYVDEPAYGPEVATMRASCDSSDKEGHSLCMARAMGAAVDHSSHGDPIKVPPCPCGMMAGFQNKLDSSFYVENPKAVSNQNMTDNNSNSQQSQSGQQGQQQPQPPVQNKDQLARETALKQMQEYDKMANEGRTNLNDTTNKKNNESNNANNEKDPNNPTIPVQYQDALNLALEKDRAANQKIHDKTIKEKDERIAELEKKIQEFNDKERSAILAKYIEKDQYKDEKTWKERTEKYAKIAKENNLSNETLEELLKDHYEVKELKISVNGGSNGKGKGAGKLNLDPFGYDEQVGQLSNGDKSNKRGKAASTNENNENNNDEDTQTEDEIADTDDETRGNGAAILKAFS